MFRRNLRSSFKFKNKRHIIKNYNYYAGSSWEDVNNLFKYFNYGAIGFLGFFIDPTKIHQNQQIPQHIKNQQHDKMKKYKEDKLLKKN